MKPKFKITSQWWCRLENKEDYKKLKLIFDFYKLQNKIYEVQLIDGSIIFMGWYNLAINSTPLEQWPEVSVDDLLNYSKIK